MGKAASDGEISLAFALRVSFACWAKGKLGEEKTESMRLVIR